MNNRLTWFVAVLTVAVGIGALATPTRMAAQNGTSAVQRYRLVDLGTLGGPNSYLPVFYVLNFLTPQALSADGTFAGWADTPDSDPYAPLCFFDCYVDRAFKWKDGVRTPLGALPGPAGLSSAVTWISKNGLIAGLSENGEMDTNLGIPAAHGVLWRNDEIVDLKTLTGGYESQATAVNDRGQVIGFASNGTPDPASIQFPGYQTRAFLWQNGVMQDLDTLGGTDAEAFYVNERGQIVGQSYTSDSVAAIPGCFGFPDVPLTSHTFLWENGKMTDLLSLGGSCTSAYALNDRGQVAGQSDTAGDLESHPFIWDGGTMTDLFLNQDAFEHYGFATWLNDAGEVVGNGRPQEDQGALVAFYWKNGAMKNLGTANGSACSVADAINSRGQVVGGSGLSASTFFPDCTGNTEHAVLWQNGQVLDLNAFVPADSDLTLNEAVFINDRGEITGFGSFPNGDTHAFVLIPCAADESDGCQDANVGAASVASRLSSPARESTASNHLLRRRLGVHRAVTAYADPLSAPYYLVASALDTYQIRLNWQEASGQSESGFNIYRCKGCSIPRTEGTKIASVSASVLAYTDGSSTSPLTETTTYTYQITAFSATGESGPSNASSATTKIEPAPTNLLSAYLVEGRGTTVFLSWTNNSTDDNSYFVERCAGLTCTNFTVIAQLGANSTGYVDGFPYQYDLDVTMRYRVRAHSPGGYSAYSNIRTQALP